MVRLTRCISFRDLSMFVLFVSSPSSRLCVFFPRAELSLEGSEVSLYT